MKCETMVSGVFGKSFGLILFKLEFICDIGTVQSYLGKCGEMRIFAMVLLKL